jgi:hypothetical protein
LSTAKAFVLPLEKRVQTKYLLPSSVRRIPFFTNSSSSSNSNTNTSSTPLHSKALSSSPSLVEASLTASDSNELIQSLLELTRHETDGTKLPTSQRESINDIVKRLEDLNLSGASDDGSVEVDYTSIPLEGEHRTVYIDSERTPQYIGPFKGTTTQYFIDGEMFQNRLTLGPFEIALSAKRIRMDGSRLKIKFASTGVNLFGKELVKKEMKEVQGVWKMVFVGEVNDHTRIDDSGGKGKGILLRVMRTPSLYILAKDL